MKIENIKFKAKRLDNGKWVVGYFYAECGNTYIIENRQKESKLNRNLTYQVDPSTVCMFTGFTDCEGKEIWEGDLLQIHIKAAIYEVVWYEKIGGFVIKVYTIDKSSPDLLGYELQTYKYKIVGNKFDKEK
jgi:uncharacterized phage protein (TIGR01671 family)